MEQRAPSSEKVTKLSRKRLKEFLHVGEIGSHINQVKGSLENIVFKGMEESEKEIRAKRMWFSLFALVLLVSLGVTLSRHAQSEVAIFHPSACLGGWMEVEKATGEAETATGAVFSNANSAILPENTIADLFCGEFKGEIPTDTQPKVLVLRIAWSTDGATSTEVIQSENFASSTLEILDASTTTNPELILTEATTTSDVNTTATGTTENFLPEESRGANQGETTSNQQQAEQTPADVPTEINNTQLPPEAIPNTEPQSLEIRKTIISFVRNLFLKAYAQEDQIQVVAPQDTPLSSQVDITQEPVVSPAELPIDTPPQTQEVIEPVIPITETTIDTPTSTITEIKSPNQEENTVEVSSTTTILIEQFLGGVGTSTQEIATGTASTTEQQTESVPLFDVLYSFDGTTWNALGGVTLEQLQATQFQIPLPEGSSWGDLSKLQLHIKRNTFVDKAPTIYLDAITLEVEVIRIPHIEPIHPDFERDIIVRDITENGVRMVTIINSDTQEEETWYMYIDESATSTEITASSTEKTSFGTTTDSTTGQTSTTTVATTTDIVPESATTTPGVDINASSTNATTTATSSDARVPQMKEKNVWKKYTGKESLPSFDEIMRQETGPSLQEVASTTDEVLEEELILDLLPDLAADKIRRIKGVFLNSIVIQVRGKTRDELWLYDAENETKERLGGSTSTSVSGEYPFGIKGGFIFWLSENQEVVYAYNPVTKISLEQVIPPHDKEKGERAEIHFAEIPWKVIVNDSEFTFYSSETGEVFSDEDGIVRDMLRKKFNLETILNPEKLNELYFSVEKEGTEEQ